MDGDSTDREAIEPFDIEDKTDLDFTVEPLAGEDADFTEEETDHDRDSRLAQQLLTTASIPTSGLIDPIDRSPTVAPQAAEPDALSAPTTPVMALDVEDALAADTLDPTVDQTVPIGAGDTLNLDPPEDTARVVGPIDPPPIIRGRLLLLLLLVVAGAASLTWVLLTKRPF